MLIDGTDRLLYFANLYSAYLQAKVDDHISPSDTMRDQWYMRVGASGVRAVYSACAGSWVGRIERVLDLPCGYGRVLRHLVKFLPHAKFDASDIDQSAVDFCASRFGARPVYSRPDLTSADFDASYDLIWVGSLFTHVSRERTRAWLEHLARFLNPGGIMVATFHGRYSAAKGAEIGYIVPDCWKKIIAGYEASGYGYADYPANAGYVCPEGGYGVSLASPVTTVADVMSIPGAQVLGYVERGWAMHQDVLVLGKQRVSES